MKLLPRFPRPLARLLAPLLGLAFLAAPAAATWSIVVVDTRTGEVAVGTATCLASTNLKRYVPVILVGRGAAAAQSIVDQTAVNRMRIRKGFERGAEPAVILQSLAAFDAGHQGRQYGIVNFEHAPVSFTGNNAGAGKKSAAGQVGNLRYAVQGNLLTGPEVVDAAEYALLNTNGDLSQRLLAAMQAARALGGDGRCSCSPISPTSCGVPPPNFVKSAHTAMMVIARRGDVDGTCNAQFGCANGQYYMLLNSIGNPTTIDPVIDLSIKYATWRLSLWGRPDHVNSRLMVERNAVAAGTPHATSRVTIELVDLDGNDLTHGGATIAIRTVDGSPGHAVAGPVVDRGDGTYSFGFFAGPTPGVDRWVVRVDDGQGPVQLNRTIVLRVEEPVAAAAYER